MKKCKMCNAEKSNTEFNKDNNSGKLKIYCKECLKAYCKRKSDEKKKDLDIYNGNF